MAKRIQVLKCPQCGSVDQKELSNEQYKCNNCGAVYFIDSDDVTINVNHRTTPPPYRGHASTVSQTGMSGYMKLFLGAGIFFLLFVIALVIINESDDKPAKGEIMRPALVKTSKKEYRDNQKKTIIFDSENPSAFSVVDRIYGRGLSDARNTFYAIFYNPKNGEIISEQKLDAPYKGKYFTSSVRTESFGNGIHYFTIGNNKLYELNTGARTFEDVSDVMFADLPQFEVGIAKIEFTSASRGEGFRVTNNQGGVSYYYPAIKKIYSDKEIFNVSRGVASGAVESYSYLLKAEQYDILGKKGKTLVENVCLSKRGTPNTKKVLRSREITPSRLYFKGSVKWSDPQKEVIVRYSPTVADDAPELLQSINVATGKANWTLTLNGSAYVRDILKLKDGYLLLLSDSKLMWLNEKGEEQSSVNLQS